MEHDDSILHYEVSPDGSFIVSERIKMELLYLMEPVVWKTFENSPTDLSESGAQRSGGTNSMGTIFNKSTILIFSPNGRYFIAKSSETDILNYGILTLLQKLAHQRVSEIVSFSYAALSTEGYLNDPYDKN